MANKPKNKKPMQLALPYKIADENFSIYEKNSTFIEFALKRMYASGNGFCKSISMNASTLEMVKVNLPLIYRASGVHHILHRKRVIIDDSIKDNHISPVYRVHTPEIEGAVEINGIA